MKMLDDHEFMINNIDHPKVSGHGLKSIDNKKIKKEIS